MRFLVSVLYSGRPMDMESPICLSLAAETVFLHLENEFPLNLKINISAGLI
jgi:hypothetical protein